MGKFTDTNYSNNLPKAFTPQLLYCSWMNSDGQRCKALAAVEDKAFIDWQSVSKSGTVRRNYQWVVVYLCEQHGKELTKKLNRDRPENPPAAPNIDNK